MERVQLEGGFPHVKMSALLHAPHDIVAVAPPTIVEPLRVLAPWAVEFRGAEAAVMNLANTRHRPCTERACHEVRIFPCDQSHELAFLRLAPKEEMCVRDLIVVQKRIKHVVTEMVQA